MTRAALFLLLLALPASAQDAVGPSPVAEDRPAAPAEAPQPEPEPDAEPGPEPEPEPEAEPAPQPEDAPEPTPTPEPQPEPVTASAPAEQVVGGLNQNRVSITAGFDGSEIFVFGAVVREAPVPEDSSPLHVVVTIEGPTLPVTVRRKERVLGIWVNTDSVEIDEAPSFYAIASTGPLDEIVSETEKLRHRIGFDYIVRTVGARAFVDDPQNFVDAVVRIRNDNGLYTSSDASVDLRQETLFSTEVELPANLVEGDYRARMFLMRNRQVLHVTEQAITVRKDGLERLIYTTAHERPLLYGIVSLAVALFAGWAASEAFRFLRR
ncbi:TIGR02186 family protein [Halovulum sp. GXIMD14794]